MRNPWLKPHGIHYLNVCFLVSFPKSLIGNQCFQKIAVILASEARRESVLWKGKQPIPDKPE